METSTTTDAMSYGFDDRNVVWHTLGDFEHLVFAMLDVDEDRRIFDALVKFEAGRQIFLHRHLAHTNTLVIQGEHRLYEPDGSLREVRPVASHTSSPPDDRPHREGGGAEGAVVFYSLRAERDTLFEILDDDLNVVGTLGMQDFIAAYKEQKGV